MRVVLIFDPALLDLEVANPDTETIQRLLSTMTFKIYELSLYTSTYDVTASDVRKIRQQLTTHVRTAGL